MPEKEPEDKPAPKVVEGKASFVIDVAAAQPEPDEEEDE